MQQLFEADGKVYDANVRLTVLRKVRDDLSLTVALEIVRLRRLILSHYEDPDLAALGLFSPRVRVPDPLIRQAETIERTFAGDDLGTLLGKPVHEGETIDPQSPLVRRPIQTAAELRTKLGEVDEARRVLDQQIVEKDAVKKEHGEVFVYTARSFEANCILAGFRRLAEKVRPSERQPGRRAVELEDDQVTPDSALPPDPASPLDDVPDETEPTP